MESLPIILRLLLGIILPLPDLIRSSPSHALVAAQFVNLGCAV